MRDSFTLPDANVLISFSGGRTSAFMLYKILEAQQFILPDSCKVVFANTGREMPETLDFVQRCGEEWGVPITWLEYTKIGKRSTFQIVNHNSASRNGEPFELLLKGKGILPNVHRRFCTQDLKVLTFKRYLKSLGWKKWINCIGIRGDEQRRIKPSKDNRWDNWYPLYHAGATKSIIMDFWEQQSFDLALWGKNGVTPKGNCDGCFLKSEATLAMMFREHPERMQWWIDIENNHSKAVGREAHFHATRRFADIENFVSRQGDWIFDTEGVLCQADDGECTGL
jgi:3'-phosphoadenosine 5'-phosphosulfate sulfotransferase (PAPS reductase)/FAD synthetase